MERVMYCRTQLPYDAMGEHKPDCEHCTDTDKCEWYMSRNCDNCKGGVDRCYYCDMELSRYEQR